MTAEHFPPLAAYLVKLERRCSLPAHERDALLALPYTLRRVNPHDLILKQGGPAEHSVFLVNGVISRQKRADGTSHIISVSFPGDAVDLQTLFFDETDHALVAHEPVTIAEVPHGALIELCDEHRFLAKMLWHDTLVDSAIFREWAMNVGHRRAPQRIGFLFLEFEARLAAIGRAVDGAYDLNLTQQELASALGLSLVHMNKSLRRLREDKLIAIRGRQVCILDKPRLVKFAGFDDSYLRLDTPPVFEKTTTLDRRAPPPISPA